MRAGLLPESIAPSWRPLVAAVWWESDAAELPLQALKDPDIRYLAYVLDKDERAVIKPLALLLQAGELPPRMDSASRTRPRAAQLQRFRDVLTAGPAVPEAAEAG